MPLVDIQTSSDLTVGMEHEMHLIGCLMAAFGLYVTTQGLRVQTCQMLGIACVSQSIQGQYMPSSL